MKHGFSACICAALLLAGLTSTAQDLSKKWSIGLGLEAGTPIGDAKNAYNFTGGLTLRFAYKTGPGFATLTSGGIAFAPKSLDGHDTKAGILIPIKAGYKWVFMKHLFVMGEVGYGSFRYYYDDSNNNLASSTTGGFLYAPSVGAQFGKFEVGVKYESVSISGGTLQDLALRLGINF